jgi:hypothetical protein
LVPHEGACQPPRGARRNIVMKGIIYLVGLVVVVLFVLSFLGLR